MPSNSAQPATESRAITARPDDAAARTALPARSSTWVSLPPGATLQVESGRIRLASGPAMCGQVLLTSGLPHVLEAGQAWCVPRAGGAAWVQLVNAGPATASVALMEPLVAPRQSMAGRFGALLATVRRVWSGRARPTGMAGGTASRA